MDAFISVLDNVKKQGDGYTARCPFHDDNENSLSINESHDGKVLYHCHAGCDQETLTEGFKDLGAIAERKAPVKKSPVTLQWMERAVYLYQSRGGEILYRVVRLEAIDQNGKTKKRFMQQRPDPSRPGRWLNNLEGVERTLYNLPALVGIANKTLFFVEGEKDADNLIGLGLTATCISGGANNWKRELAVNFKGSNLVIIPDNDGPGKKLAQKVYEDCGQCAKSVKILNLPGLGDKEDVSDWLARGHDVDELMVLVEEIEPEEPTVSHIEWVHMRGKAPSCTIENIETLLKHFKIDCVYNEMSKEIEITIPGKPRMTTENAYTHVESLAESFGISRGAVAKSMNYIAAKQSCDPVKEWITSKPWDGVDRIHPLCDSLDSSNRELTDLLVVRWLLGATAAVFEPDGAPQGGVLVLQGDQYIGKTAWFWSLMGGNRKFGHDSFPLNPKDKDSVAMFCRYWLVEFGEFDSVLRKSSAPDLKAFITRNDDEFRRPYDRTNSKFPRRTAMLATINPTNFLKDTTGNRRYWVIECGEDFNPNHGLDAQQLWAQVYSQLYLNRKGLFKEQHYAWHLTQEENKMLAHHNHDFDEISPIEDKLLTTYDFAMPHDQLYTASDIAHHLGYTETNKSINYHIGEQIRKITGQKKTIRKDRGARRCYKMPKPKTFGRQL